MNLIKPAKLKQGDTIAFIAPSGSISEDKVYNAEKYFKEKGFNVVLGANILKNDRYMAGSDEERINDIHRAFEDKNINAILCARGGYGAIRLINNINYDIIRNNPKIFCGYSDISALSAMILKKTGLITFSSPMPKGDFQPNDIDEFTVNNFFNTLTSDSLEIKPQNMKVFNNGNAQGILFGGNLATIASLCGTDFIPDEKFIFFAEDLSEPVYKIDRYFRQLLNIDKFKKNISGLILGEFLDAEPDELFKEIVNELNIPTFGGYKITHAKQKITVPYGAFAKLEQGIITIKEY